MSGREFSPSGGDVPPGLRRFGEKLKRLLHARIIKDRLPEQNVSSDWLVLGLIGGTWRLVREESELLSVESAVERINTIGQFPMEVDDLILFEGGWIDPADYKEGLIEAIGKAYGHQELAEVQMDFFNRARNKLKKQPPTF